MTVESKAQPSRPPHPTRAMFTVDVAGGGVAIVLGGGAAALGSGVAGLAFVALGGAVIGIVYLVKWLAR